MRNLARKLESNDAFQEVGHVLSVEGAELVVRTDSGDHRSRRAVSCLVQPEPRDVVHLSRTTRGGSWVLGILEREAGAATRLRVDGDVELQVPSGRFTVAAQEGIDLVSAKEVSVVSGSVDIHAVDGNVNLERLSFLGTFVRAEIEKIKLLAGTFDSVLERLSLRAKRSYRTIEELDQVKAEQIDYAARSTMSLRGENTLVTAEELVKVDGAQIHVG